MKYVKAKKSKGIAFEGCVLENGVGVTLSLDVPTRWNPTYLMLEKALRYQRTFNRLKVFDKSYKHCPSNDKWSKAENIMEILKPFYKITILMSGRSYSTSNLYFGHVWKIECLLKENECHSDKDIRDMACRMRIKFTKYWDQYSVILAMAAALDAIMKIKLLKRCYVDLDPSTYKEKLEHIETKLRLLFEDYVKKYPTTTSTTNASSATAHETNKQGREKFDVLDVSFLSKLNIGQFS